MTLNAGTNGGALLPFTPASPCPICKGWDADDADPRCMGWTSKGNPREGACWPDSEAEPAKYELPPGDHRLPLTASEASSFDLESTADRLIRLIGDNPFDPRLIQLAAGLRRNSPGEYERVVIAVRELKRFRVRAWEGAVAAAGKRAARAEVSGDLMAHLVRNPTGEPKAALSNAVAFLERTEVWRHVLAWNEHSQVIEWLKPPPWPDSDCALEPRGVWGEREDTLLVCELERTLGITLRPSQVRAAARLVAQRFAIHPIRDYLERLEWDGVPRVNTWLATYLGATSQPADYLQDVGSWTLVSAVARAMKPGCKVDTMLVLEGGQGDFKSTAIEVLASKPHYVEVDAAILGTADKDTMLTCRLAWIVEAGEFDSVGGANMARLKANVSRAVDTYRAPYGADAQKVPRGWIGIGTTNLEAYLRDSTGGRRFHPVRVGRVDLEALRRDRDQLWAEAYALYAKGAKWWPDADERPAMLEEQEKRRLVDEWEETIAPYLAKAAASGDFVTTSELLARVIDKPVKDWGRGDSMRMADCLRALGWRRGERCRRDGALVWPWHPPGTVWRRGKVGETSGPMPAPQEAK